jgi:undecaprenyl-diphosphatase
LLRNTNSQKFQHITNLFEVIFLGLVQGLTEFLPISSSAHLRIVGEFLPNAKDPGAAFTAITQIGTELAVLIYFRREILSIVKMGWMIIIGSVPIFIFGFLFQDSIKTTFRSLTLVALMLILFGLILGFADYVGDNQKGSRDLKVKEALTLGFAQSLALVPGVSRSGATIAAGRLLGFNRSAATKFSFFLAVPAVLGSGLYQLYQVISDPTSEVYSLGETFLATFIAFAVGYAVIAWLMKYISKNSFRPFVIYRLILGSAILIAIATNFLN